MNMQHAGELAGLATSALWVVSSLAFAAAGRSIGATQLNLLRSLLACAFLLGLQWFLHGNPWPTIGGHSTLFLAISGLLGLAIGDQFLFAGYVLVGPRSRQPRRHHCHGSCLDNQCRGKRSWEWQSR